MKKNFFPYPFREKQRELIQFVQEEVWNGSVCVNAATGFGKTPAILAALLPHAENHRIIWAVRTGNETDRPIEELKEINRAMGSDFFGLSYRGKRDMCLLARDLRMEGEMSYEDVSFLCKAKGKECRYRQNLEELDPTELVKGPLLYSEILSICRDLEICPYLVQRELLPLADVVSLSYNYIVNEKMGWSIKSAIPFRDSFLVIDEAHNLQYACSSLNSDRITLGTVAYALKEIDKIKTERAGEIRDFILTIRIELDRVLEEMDDDEAEFDISSFLRTLRKERGIGLEGLVGEFESIKKYGTRIRREQLKKGKRPRSSLYHLANFWLSAIENLGIDGIAFLVSKEKDNLIVEMWDMRAAVILRERWKDFRACVFCSGTLNPIKAFAETIGLDKYSGKTFHSHYNPQNIVALITEGLSTKGERLGKRMAEKYVDAIESFLGGMNTNLAVFSASYRIQNNLLKAGLKDIIEEKERIFFQEIQGMSGDKARKILDEFKRCANNRAKGVLCATTTGRFAEGADFPGKELEGIFIVGIPFDRMTVRTRIYLDYYGSLYGKNRGDYYAYIVPALRRASQSLGRALRSKEDRAVFICGDERYADKRFFRLLPDFVCESAEVIDYTSISEKLKSWREYKASPMNEILEKLQHAVNERMTIEIKYSGKRGLTERLVDPYEIRELKYVVGRCHLQDGIRTFRIDGIRELRLTDNVFSKPDVI